MSNTTTIGSRIKELRTTKGVTLAVLGGSIGYSHAIISRWERSVYTPNAYGIIALAKYFGVSCDYILCVTDNDKPYA